MQPPHSPLTRYYGKEQDRAGWVRGLFDRTAPDYDRVERAMAFGSGSWYRRHALARAGLKPGMRVLDIGTGTGLTAREAAYLVGPAGEVTGVDPSAGMMERARVPACVRLLAGTAEAIPSPPAEADFLCMGYALRHIGDLPLVLSEYLRVLKPGGRVCLLEITAPQSRLSRTALRIYMRGIVPLMARCMAAHRDMPELMRYYWDTIEACVPPDRILTMMQGAGFIDVYRHVDLGIFSEYCGRKPL
ncbi:MAG TPA: class I SAM-dependent methyltransferase [Steroidobacteraceae bacterium]|jgi:demethylmenaquinone methyltransferase/2-methoxy-6-polyprenyl-1,4-benzoquinol methylase|nr:class I SAM-dependent methyltransferase [Steroidobacteraceae bacterium]